MQSMYVELNSRVQEVSWAGVLKNGALIFYSIENFVF